MTNARRRQVVAQSKRPDASPAVPASADEGKFYQDLAAEGREIGLHAASDALPGEASLRQLRRRAGSRRARDDRFSMLALTEVDGVLRWEEGGALARPAGPSPARLRGEAGAAGDLVRAQFKFERLPASDVGEFLTTLDRKFATQPGLKVLSGPRWEPLQKPLARKKILLIIHGTFSNADNVLAEFRATSHGRSFLERARTKYDQVLAFDHWTLSTSPVMNALDLGRLLQATPAQIDVIAHSRGGLVARWWAETFDRQTDRKRRLVLVGAPLGGTSLASPPRLRSALDHLANVFRTVQVASGLASAALPVFTVLAGLMRVLASVGRATARVPLIDAAVAMIPGLAAQSRVGNSPELTRLRLATGDAPANYIAVKADFEPQGVGWAFWQLFVRARQRLADVGADIVFDGENDLVVDSASMTFLADNLDLPRAQVLDFGTTDRVHHLNYFRQKETLEFLGRKWGV
ncbi:MAG: hypothetical protein RBT60_08880 [Candidatus Krumholzibacteria bacterium]|jgi:pimeloyl-ACP methyl ester carboxylesterase|nr:hypothetical protein [Candidatus Krumholzibacteria bacterium]